MTERDLNQARYPPDTGGGHDKQDTTTVIKWAIIFAVAALVLAVLGFGGLAGAFMDIAQILFWLAIVIAVLLFALGFTVYKKVT